MKNDNLSKSPVPDDAISTNQGDNTTQQPNNPGANTPTPKIPIPEQAADSELIEKEWVEKAKQIVDHTRNNPYEQQKELSKVKAEYMKKRYNKDIKTSDE